VLPVALSGRCGKRPCRVATNNQESFVGRQEKLTPKSGNMDQHVLTRTRTRISSPPSAKYPAMKAMHVSADTNSTVFYAQQ
jgi:hypothetical protein